MNSHFLNKIFLSLLCSLCFIDSASLQAMEGKEESEEPEEKEGKERPAKRAKRMQEEHKKEESIGKEVSSHPTPSLQQLSLEQFAKNNARSIALSLRDYILTGDPIKYPTINLAIAKVQEMYGISSGADFNIILQYAIKEPIDLNGSLLHWAAATARFVIFKRLLSYYPHQFQPNNYGETAYQLCTLNFWSQFSTMPNSKEIIKYIIQTYIARLKEGFKRVREALPETYKDTKRYLFLAKESRDLKKNNDLLKRLVSNSTKKNFGLKPDTEMSYKVLTALLLFGELAPGLSTFAWQLSIASTDIEEEERILYNKEKAWSLDPLSAKQLNEIAKEKGHTFVVNICNFIGMPSATFTAFGNTTLHTLAARGTLEEMRSQLAKDPSLLNKKNRLGNTPLHIATQYDRPEIVRFLLAQEADPNIKNNNGDRPLHVGPATLSARELLLSPHLNVNTFNKLKETPLQLLVQNFNHYTEDLEDRVKFFIKHGASAWLYGSNLQYAQEDYKVAIEYQQKDNPFDLFFLSSIRPLSWRTLLCIYHDLQYHKDDENYKNLAKEIFTLKDNALLRELTKIILDSIVERALPRSLLQDMINFFTKDMQWNLTTTYKYQTEDIFEKPTIREASDFLNQEWPENP